MADNFDHAEAVRDAASLGVEPVAFTTIEGGEWQRAPLAERVHSVWFSNGDQWDEHNGWRGPRFRGVFDDAKIGGHD